MKKLSIVYICALVLALFTACNSDFDSHITYEVIHMQQNIEDDNYTEVDRETLTVNAGGTTKAAAKDYEGFTPQDFSQEKLYESKNIVIKYDRNPVTFDFNLAGGAGETSITRKYGTPVTKEIILDPVKGNSKFSFWYPELPEAFTENAAFTANWDYSSYKVKFMFQDIEGEGYTLDSALPSPEETFFGNGGEETSYEAPFVQGFEVSRIEQAVLGEEEQTVTVYYDRLLVTVYIDLDGGDGVSVKTGRVGAPFVITEEEKSSYKKIRYTYGGYDKALPEVYRLEDNNRTVLKVQWIGVGEARYSVRFYCENLDRSREVYSEDSELTVNTIGKVGEETDVQLSGRSVIVNGQLFSVTGFHPVTEGEYILKNEIIKGNETTIVKVYFDRNVSTLTLRLNGFNVDGNTDDIIVYGRYGEEIKIPDINPQKDYYRFCGWQKLFADSKTHYGAEEEDLKVNISWDWARYTIRVYSNTGDDLPSEQPYKDYIYDERGSYLSNERERHIEVSRTDYENGVLKKPYHKCTGISATPDGEVIAFEEYHSSSSIPYSISITIPRMFVKDDGQILEYYLQWSPYTIEDVRVLTGSISAEGVFTPGITLWSGYSNSSAYANNTWGEPEVFISIDGEDLYSYISTADDKTFDLKSAGINLNYSETHTIGAKVGYNISGNPEEKRYLFSNEKFIELYTPVGPVTDFRIVDQDTNNELTFSWKNPPSADGIESVKLILKSKIRNSASEDKQTVEYSISNGNTAELEPEKEITVSFAPKDACYRDCYIEITDVHGSKYSTTEGFRIFPLKNNFRAGGQIYYSDDTWSNEYIPGKTPIGIVAQNSNGIPFKIIGLKISDALYFSTAEFNTNNNHLPYSTSNSGDRFEQDVINLNLNPADFPALSFCRNYRGGGYDDWYLPGYGELDIVVHSSSATVAIIQALQSLKENGVDCDLIDEGKYYWNTYVHSAYSPVRYSAFSPTSGDDYYCAHAGYRYSLNYQGICNDPDNRINCAPCAIPMRKVTPAENGFVK